MSGRASRILRALIVAAALLLIGAVALADAIEVKLNTSAKVYSSLTSSARSIKAPKGLRVSLKAYAKGWGKISYKGRIGYVQLKYLDRVDPLKAYVTKSTTVYRDASDERKLTTVPTGTLVYALGVDGSYVRIMNSSGKWKGYIKSGVLSASKPSAATSVNASNAVPEKLRASAEGAQKSKIEKAIYIAQSLVGAPYAENPEPPKSFDCASFTYYCFNAAGVKLKGTSKSQGEDDSYDKVEGVSALKRGDLVCFNTVEDSDLSDHVGLYLGVGYFIHGSSVAKKVIVSQLSSGYYNRVFSWGRRIFK